MLMYLEEEVVAFAKVTQIPILAEPRSTLALLAEAKGIPCFTHAGLKVMKIGDKRLELRFMNPTDGTSVYVFRAGTEFELCLMIRAGTVGATLAIAALNGNSSFDVDWTSLEEAIVNVREEIAR